ncbi:FAD-binding domain-containing protein [Crepidotus variabilis]|uniref:FAD-binding domain-containing protein n=1 Tax=Crepidotus variabilis TaxID=179855 RepID=A0A9P6JT37_9AGAR|nr:FAD-binding domain-containing protein [Crepidotus variabilis]
MLQALSRFAALSLLLSRAAANLNLPSDPVCEDIKDAVSTSSAVFYPGTLEYSKGVFHYISSSSDSSNCVVEPGTAADVGVILGILGQTKTKFGVKGGGHASNPGFSSTPGVQIYMGRFSSVVYNQASQTAEIGAGLIWDDVYAALEPHGVNVVGGRVSGVGVAGFTLGGGYSWKSNQYGLTIDTVTAYELVKPDGTVTTVTPSDEDLFFALKGGFNNFGIVTKFTLKTFPQTQVWGGVMTIPFTEHSKVSAATANFAANVTDPKASIITTFNAVAGVGQIAEMLLFYDAPTPPDGIFNNFTSIPALQTDVKTRSFISLVQASPSNVTTGQRGRFNTVSLQEITPQILDVITDEFLAKSTSLLLGTGTFVSYDIEPFLSSAYGQSASTSAYPSTRGSTILPLNLYFAWLLPTSDSVFHDAIKESASTIAAAAITQGQNAVSSNVVYPNYATWDTPLEKVYGANLPRLEAIKASVDPQNIMGLAGGFKF